MLEIRREFGLDTFCYYYALAPNQKAEILTALKVKPGFKIIESDYFEESYEYHSDCFAVQGIKLQVFRKKKSIWGLFVLLHPTLLLGIRDHSALYTPSKQSYHEIVDTADKLLQRVNIPCSVDHMKLYRLDITANLIFPEENIVMAYLHVLKKSRMLPQYQLDWFRKKDGKARNSKEANRHSYKQKCRSASFFAYDKTAQLEMIDRFPAKLKGKRVLRLEAQLRRKVLRKWVKKDDMDNNWRILKCMGKDLSKPLRWYLKRLQPKGNILRYEDAVKQIQSVRKHKTRERMLYLLRKTSDCRDLTAALEALCEKYGLSSSQRDRVLKKFADEGISLITLPNCSEIGYLSSIKDLL